MECPEIPVESSVPASSGPATLSKKPLGSGSVFFFFFNFDYDAMYQAFISLRNISTLIFSITMLYLYVFSLVPRT